MPQGPGYVSNNRAGGQNTQPQVGAVRTSAINDYGMSDFHRDQENHYKKGYGRAYQDSDSPLAGLQAQQQRSQHVREQQQQQDAMAGQGNVPSAPQSFPAQVSSVPGTHNIPRKPILKKSGEASPVDDPKLGPAPGPRGKLFIPPGMEVPAPTSHPEGEAPRLPRGAESRPLIYTNRSGLVDTATVRQPKVETTVRPQRPQRPEDMPARPPGWRPARPPSPAPGHTAHHPHVPPNYEGKGSSSRPGSVSSNRSFSEGLRRRASDVSLKLRRASSELAKAVKIVAKGPAEREELRAERTKAAILAARRKSAEREQMRRANPQKRPDHQKSFIFEREAKKWSQSHPDEVSPYENTGNMPANYFEARAEQHLYNQKIKQAYPPAEVSPPISEAESSYSMNSDERRESQEASGEPMLKPRPTPFSSGEMAGFAAAKFVDKFRKGSVDSDKSFFSDPVPAQTMRPCLICNDTTSVLKADRYCNTCFKNNQEAIKRVEAKEKAWAKSGVHPHSGT